MSAQGRLARRRIDGNRRWQHAPRGDKYGRRHRLIALAGILIASGIVGGLILAELATGSVSVPQAGLLPVTSAPTTAPLPSITPASAATPTPAGPAIVAGDWPAYLAQGGTGFNPAEKTISPLTANLLAPEWTQHATSVVSTQPVVANHLIYWGDWDGFERATTLAGKPAWSVNLGRTLPGGYACGYSYSPNPGVVSTASVTVVNGRSIVIVGGGDAQLYALDALTGAVIWHTRLGPSPSHFIWSSPAVANGSVYIGVASFADCPLVRGKVVRLDVASGEIEATWYVVPSGCAGGTVWGSPTVDAANRYVYVATGGPDVHCGLPQPYTGAVVKLSASTLTLVDVWQVPYGEQTGDRDFGNTPTLFAYTDRAGVVHPMVGVGHKNGTYYAFDRNHLSAGPVWERTIAAAGTQPLADVGIISPSAFDGARLYVAGELTADGSNCAGSLRALNPADGALIWVRCLPEGPVFGAVTTANGVVVVGEGPRIVMVDAATGATVYAFVNPSGAWFYGAASIAHGALYQANTDGTLFAFVPGLGHTPPVGLAPGDNGGEVADAPRAA